MSSSTVWYLGIFVQQGLNSTFSPIYASITRMDEDSIEFKLTTSTIEVLHDIFTGAFAGVFSQLFSAPLNLYNILEGFCFTSYNRDVLAKVKSCRSKNLSRLVGAPVKEQILSLFISPQLVALMPLVIERPSPNPVAHPASPYTVSRSTKPSTDAVCQPTKPSIDAIEQSTSEMAIHPKKAQWGDIDEVTFIHNCDLEVARFSPTEFCSVASTYASCYVQSGNKKRRRL